jgi:dystroglycan 1
LKLNFQPSHKSSSVATTASAPTTIKEDRRTPLPLIPTSPGEDDEEDEEEEEPDESVLLGLPSTTLPPTLPSLSTTAQYQSTTTSQTTFAPEVTSEPFEATSDSDYGEENQPPSVVKRIKKIQATSGKAFTYKLEEAIFEDDEDGKNLRLELLDKSNQQLPSASWIRFDAKKQEIYGLPLENDVSRHEFKLRATDSGGEYVDENVDVTVQQHKSYRSVNHEIFIQVTLDKQYDSDVDWKIRLIRGIVEALDDDSIGSIVVRDVTQNKYEPKQFTFSYTNDSLPKDHCPKEELELLMLRLTKKALNDVMRREISVRNVQKELINSCAEVKAPLPPPSQPNNKQNFPPTVRNPVDRVGATVGQLLVFAVPKDTFYDPEDQNDLKLSLLNENRSPLDPSNWLQFDAKNHEFYGVPTIHDKTQTYVLVAEDKSGLSTNDALLVEVNNLHSKRDYGATFEYQLEIGIDQFQNAGTKRRFIERIQQFFGNADANAILIKSIKKVQYSGRTAVVVQNTTLHHRTCPVDEITKLKNRLIRTDGSLREEVKQAIGSEFNVQKINIVPIGEWLLLSSFSNHQ